MVLEIVRRARRRILANEALRHGAYSASAALVSLILLLLVGSQVLGWSWLLLPAIAVAAGTYAASRSAPSLYLAAQRVDRNLRLADTLSTAVFFAAAPPAAPDDVRTAQFSQAERAAAAVDPRRAIPIRLPRALFATALLALVAGSLFALRFGLERRLDLRTPLARIIQEKLGYPASPQVARDHRRPAGRDPKRPEEAGLALDPAQQKSPGELDAAPDSALDTVGVPDADSKTASSRPDNSNLARSAQLEGESNSNEEPEGVSANPSDRQPGDSRKAATQAKQGRGEDPQSSGNSGENSSLLGKFRDAMSSLMNRMRQQTGSKGGREQAAMQNGAQKGQSGQNGKQGQQPGAGQQADAKDAESGEDSQSAQNSQPGSQGEGGQQPATKQPGSGIGRQDGSKDVKLAEQLAAMGKISEIIGKRAANVTGEVTVEAENSNRQLRTPYAAGDAHHQQAGGEIHRDEVPVALQQYVEQYFEQIRKQAPRPRTESQKPGT